VLSIEFAPAKTRPCKCCGRMTTTLTRFVHRDGDAYAIYHAAFTDGHPNRVVLGTVYLGPWDDDSRPDQRVAFAFQLTAASDRYDMSLIDAALSPWHESELVGRTLDTAEALRHPALSEVYAMADLMMTEDEPLRAYLDGSAT
jgi:hypothetical protein